MSRAAAGLLLLIPLRIGLDLTWPWTVGPLSAPQLGSAVIALLLGAAVALRWRAAVRHPWRWELAAFCAVLFVGALRAQYPWDAARYGLLLVTPVLWLLAWHAVAPAAPTLPRAWFAAAAVPVALSLGLLAAGQPADHVLNGWPRLVGPYGNVHGCAVAMAVFAGTGLPWAALRRDRLVGLVALGAALCLGATWVRGAWLWAGLAAGLVLAVRGRWREALGATVLAGVLVLGIAALRDRWSDLVAIGTGTAPEAGWGALGSWRGRIWAESLTAWLAGPTRDVWLGRGLGGQYGLHRHLDPHSDWLSLLFQLGPAGLLVWLAWMGRALWDLGRRSVSDPLAAVAFGVLGGAVAVSAIGNDWSTRPTPVLWTFGLVGLAISRPAGSPAPTSPGSAAPSEPTPG